MAMRCPLARSPSRTQPAIQTAISSPPTHTQDNVFLCHRWLNAPPEMQRDTYEQAIELHVRSVTDGRTAKGVRPSEVNRPMRRLQRRGSRGEAADNARTAFPGVTHPRRGGSAATLMSGARGHYSRLLCRCVPRSSLHPSIAPLAEPHPRSVIRTIPFCIEMCREREFTHPLSR